MSKFRNVLKIWKHYGLAYSEHFDVTFSTPYDQI